jgi:hypothetical protein
MYAAIFMSRYTGRWGSSCQLTVDGWRLTGISFMNARYDVGGTGRCVKSDITDYEPRTMNNELFPSTVNRQPTTISCFPLPPS